MTLRARACLLILTLVWQAVAWLSPVGQAQMTERLVNVLAHAQSVAHHHHGDDQHHDHGVDHGHLQDASLLLDEASPSSHASATEADAHPSSGAPHHHANEAVQSVGLLPQAGDLTAEAPRPPRVSHPSALLASVFLQGPLRPPQGLLA